MRMFKDWKLFKDSIEKSLIAFQSKNHHKIFNRLIISFFDCGNGLELSNGCFNVKPIDFDEFCVSMQNNKQKLILNAMGAMFYYTIIMQKKQLPPQPPMNPFMHHFPFPYLPPPYMNPMMNMPPKPNPANGQEEHYPPPGLPMPPFGYPLYPMMPPPPEAFFRYHEAKMMQKERQDLNLQQQKKEKAEVRDVLRKKVPGYPKPLEKKANEIIVLSDDEDGVTEGKPFPTIHKKDVDNKINISNDSTFASKTRKIEKKAVMPPKSEIVVKKTRPMLKKRQSKVIKQKQENQSFEGKEIKLTTPTSTENSHEHFNRSTRIKYLMIKQGKGKIMIGEEFQASLPSFFQKDQSYTIWLAGVKQNLNSRLLQERL